MEELVVPPQLSELADRVGDFVHHWGFKRIHGRIWTHIALSKTPLDAGQLIKRLKVSKALISMSLSDLLSYDCIMETGKSLRGTTLYRVNPDVLLVITNIIKQREQRLFSRLVDSHRALKDLDAELLKRADVDFKCLKALGALIGGASKGLEGFVASHQFNMGLPTGFRLTE